VLSLAEARQALADHHPHVIDAKPRGRAAVAVVLRDDRGPMDLLFIIERASREGDPWSGHIAFPGGWVDKADTGPQAAAERETLEEVGLSLAGAAQLGRLDDMPGMRSSESELVVSAFVYHLPHPAALTPNAEVREAFWFPIDSLLDDRRQVAHPTEQGMHSPGIALGEKRPQVLWGLTYRFLAQFLKHLGRSLPEGLSSRGDTET